MIIIIIIIILIIIIIIIMIIIIIRTVADDVERVIQAAEKTGLTLSDSKCEIITSNFDIIENIDTFRDFRRVASQHMTLLGAPVLKGPAVDCALQHKVDDLQRAVDRLARLHSHDALMLLRNSLAMPKLLYTLRTYPCAHNKLLTVFDSSLRDGLITILNIDLTDDQWTHAFLPIRNG